MITIQDLQEAIAECQGERNPNAQTCIKLAAYYTIMDHMDAPPSYSFQPAPFTLPQEGAGMPLEASYEGNSEFGKAIAGKSMADVLPVLDELMEAIRALHPKLYTAVIRKLEG